MQTQRSQLPVYEKGLRQETPEDAQTQSSHGGPRTPRSKQQPNRTYKLAIDGVLGLATLMSNSDCGASKSWTQAYQIKQSNTATTQIMPRKFIADAYAVYFNIQN